VEVLARTHEARAQGALFQLDRHHRARCQGIIALATLLRSEGYDVDLAFRRTDALALVDRTPDVIVLDGGDAPICEYRDIIAYARGRQSAVPVAVLGSWMGRRPRLPAPGVKLFEKPVDFESLSRWLRHRGRAKSGLHVVRLRDNVTFLRRAREK
jgi:CheY-like chemotaxis protein